MTVTSNIDKETVSKTSTIECFRDKYNGQINFNVLNNFNKELNDEIKQHISSRKSLKTSGKNVDEHITVLKDQVESLKGEILFLRQESREKNVLTKFKCIAFTSGDMEFYNINKGNNINHSKNENSSSKNIIENLDNNSISNYNTNDSIEHTNNGNNTSFSNVRNNSNVISATSNDNNDDNTLDPKFNYHTQDK